MYIRKVEPVRNNHLLNYLDSFVTDSVHAFFLFLAAIIFPCRSFPFFSPHPLSIPSNFLPFPLCPMLLSFALLLLKLEELTLFKKLGL